MNKKTEFSLRNLLLFATLLLTAACSPSSIEEYQHEGAGVIRQLIEELGSIEAPKDFDQATLKLKKLFDDLVDLMIEGQVAHPNSDTLSSLTNNPNAELSEKLRLELIRVYGLEGGREFVEDVEATALLKIDNFEQDRQLN